MKLAVLILSLFGTVAAAQPKPVDLLVLLHVLDHRPITISGLIWFDSGYDGGFTFYDTNRNSYSVTIDAGRPVREEVEVRCAEHSSYKDMCEIEALAEIEIEGRTIQISITEILSLSNNSNGSTISQTNGNTVEQAVQELLDELIGNASEN